MAVGDKTEWLGIWPDGIEPPNPCFWCGEQNRRPTMCCERCYPFKEEGYRRAREASAQGLGEVYPHVWDVLEENGVAPIPPFING